MRKETIKTLQGDCHENEKNNEIGGPNNSIKKRNERIIEAYQTENTSIAGLAERFGVSKRTIGNVTHSLKEQNLQQQSLTNETTKEKEESNNQNIEAYLAGDLWVSKLVNKFNGSARTILMKIKKAREQKEEMQYKTSSENEILQLDRNSFEQREELVKQQELISEVLLKDELEQVHPAQPRSLEDKVISLRKQKSVDHDSQSKKYNLNDSSGRKRKMQENKDPEKFSLSAFPIDKNSLKTSSVKPKKPKKSYVLHEVEEYSPKLSQISKQIHTTENEHLIDENQQDKLQGIGPQQNKNFSSSLPLPNKLEEATSSENHIFNSKQVQVTGSHLRENQEEHPILSETEGEFGNSLFDSLSDFDYSNESNEERSFFQKSANLSDELSNHNLTTDEIVEALMEFDETLDSAKNIVDYVNGSNELAKQSNNDLFDDSSNDSLMTDEIVEVDETLDSAKNLVDYVNGSNELAKQSNNDLFDDSSNDSLMTDEIVEALVEVDETLDSAKNLVDYVNGSNELPKQSNNDLFEDLSNDSLTTDEIVEALMEIDETLDPAKNLVDYVNGSNELAKQSNNDLFEDSSNDSLMTEEITEILMRFDETLNSGKKPMKYVMELSERQESNKLFDESSNSQQVEYPIMEQTMAGKAVNQPGSENNQVNFIEDQNQEYLIDEEKHPQNPHNIHNDRGTGEFIQKKQDKSIKNSENTPVNQNQETALDEERHPKRAAAHLSENLHSIQNLESNLGHQTTKQTDKQTIPQTGYILDPVLPQNVTKNNYLEYIQLYQSIQSTIKIETFCDIMELSQDTFQELLKEAVPAESTNSELGYIENKREIIPREYKLEKINLYLNSQHSYESKRQFCDKNNLDYDSFRSWIREHKKGELPRQSISTIEELISREQDGRNLYCTAKVKKACVLLWRSKRIAHKVLCKKLNISDATLRTWNNRYDQARGKKQELITTLTELKERKLKLGKLCCTEEVKRECVLLYKNQEMSIKQLCKIYHLTPNMVNAWIEEYDRLLQNSERTSQARQTFSTNVGNAKFTTADNNARLAHEQGKSQGNQRMQHSIQNLESNLGDQTTKQTDKQLNPPARHSLDPVLPQKVNQSYTKNDYLKYIQLYQSIQTTIKIETFCDIMELSQDTFQELLKEAVPAESTNSELGYIENKREIIPREYKLEKINLYLNSQHSYKSKRQFCDKNNLDYSSFSSWIKEHKKGNLTRKSISTIEELISRERNGRNLDCTAKVKEACVLLWRGCSMTKTELSNKLNINDMVVRSWEDRYNRAHGNEQKKIITTLSELENRDLKFRYLSCTEKVKKECILLLNDTKNTKGRICQKYHLNVKTFYNWYNKYKPLLNGAEKDSKERQTFSTNVENAKITAADNNARLANEQNKSPNLFLGNQKIQ
ncbi:transposase [Enterococcus hirae]